MSDALPLSINVSKTQTITFDEEFLTYKEACISYKDIQGISYEFTRMTHLVNFIPTHTSETFTIKLKVNSQIYEVHSSAKSFMFLKGKNQKEQEATFRKLVHILNSVVKPFVIINLLDKYIKEGELKIGEELTINSNGFYKKNVWIWRGDPEFFPWNQYYNSVLSQGNLEIYKRNTANKASLFFSCSTSTMNAAVMPDLLNFLFQKHGVLDQEAIKVFEKIKSESTPH